MSANTYNDSNNTPRLVVLGGGESGVGAAILAKAKGMDVFLSDAGTLAPHYADELRRRGIPFEEGGHTPALILNATEVVKSPGIPPTAPMVAEIEFGGRYTTSRMICITGSNGKTTTTMLIHHILRSAGIDASLAGNVGRSLAWQVAEEPHDVYVVELSSFQLENMYDFRANIAVMMNITPDHMDRYEYKMENYVRAKFRILQNQQTSDAFIYWEDDPVIRRQLEQVVTEARRFPFAEYEEAGAAAFLDADGRMVLRTPAGEFDIPRDDLALKGLHNLFNSMAAGLSACLMDVRKDDIRRALCDFEGVPHRLENAGTVNGVRWINDSKATNVNSCWYALESMPDNRSTVLILGGKDKGNDYSEILPLVRRKVKAIVAMGKDNAKILDYFGKEAPGIPVADTHSLDSAVEACRAAASGGDTVLLSPCCASFDLFKSYEDRGDRFKAAVKALTEK